MAEDGTILEKYAYDVYGRMTAVKVWNGSALVSISDADSDGFIDQDEYYGNAYVIENPYLFQGRRLDRESGLRYSFSGSIVSDSALPDRGSLIGEEAFLPRCR